MSYHDTVSALGTDAEQLEQVYRAALKAGEADAFKRAIDASHTAAPDNLLYAAWFHRLQDTAARATAYVVSWVWAVPLAVINGLLFWWLSDDRFTVAIRGFQGSTRDFLPATILLAGPLAAVCALVYLAAVARKGWRLGAAIGAMLLGTGAYVLLTYPQTGIAQFQEQYLTLMVMHLPLLAWAGVGTFLAARHRDATNRLGFLFKSLEVFGVGGLFFVVLGVFTAITFGLFQALDVDVPETVQRLFIAGGAGLIAVVAPAVVYNPTVPPAQQAAGLGYSKLMFSVMCVLLSLTLVVLVVYLGFVPFHFRAPFESRDVLIVYNAMLFAVIALLLGTTWAIPSDLSLRIVRWLRWGMVAVAILTLVVSLYALAAILYRTALDRLTPNRLSFIGWNVVNIGLLLLLLLSQLRAKEGRWRDGLYRALSAGTVMYAAWALVVILAIPWLFGIDREAIEDLPPTVQEIVYEHPRPILLKCATSPHIYLLEKGEKRWIDTIETFDDRGYRWRDVRYVPCSDLRAVPDGVPIPADAGPPPQP